MECTNRGPNCKFDFVVFQRVFTVHSGMAPFRRAQAHLAPDLPFRSAQDGRQLTTPSRPSGFSKAAQRSAPAFSCFASTKQPLVIYGSRPAAVARARQLQGKPNIIAAVLEQALIEEILARLNCGSVRRSRHGLSAAPFSKRGARRRAW